VNWGHTLEKTDGYSGRKLKYGWLRPEDYVDKETLRYQVWLALNAVGKSLMINFSAFRRRESLNLN